MLNRGARGGGRSGSVPAVPSAGASSSKSHADGYDNDGTLLDDSQQDQLADHSIYNFLDALDLLQHYKLFSGYDSVTSLCVLTEADFVRIGIVNARQRRLMLARLEREFGAPSPQQRTTMVRSASQQAVNAPPSLLPPKKKGLKGRFPLKATERHGLFSSKSTKSLDVQAAPPVSSSPRSSVDSTAVSEVLQDPNALLLHQPWFHGKISRKLAEGAVRNDGDVLMRESTSKPGQYVLTTLWKGKPMHFVVDTVHRTLRAKPAKSGSSKGKRSVSRSSFDSVLDADGCETLYRFGGEAFPSIVDLVNHHLRTKQPISDANGPVAHYAVPRHVTRSSDDRASLGDRSSLLGSRRNSLRLDELETISLIDMPRRDTYACPPSPGVASLGAMSLPAGRPEDQSPPPKQKTGIFSTIRGKSPLRQRRSNASEGNMGSSLSISSGRHLSGSSGSLHKAPSLESLRNPDLPDRDMLKAVCSVVLQHSAHDLARHIARINLQTTHILLPKELAPPDSPYLPLLNGSSVRMSAEEAEVVRSIQSSWEAGSTVGLGNVLLPQGKDFAELLLRRFHSLARWAAIVVLGAGDLLSRCTALRKLTEVAQSLQSDAIGDLFGFQAVMHGLSSKEVRRLEATWSEFRQNDSKVAMLYESQLCGLDLSLRQGINTHQHIPVSLPPLQPVLELLTMPMAPLAPEDLSPPEHSWFPEDDLIGSLDATVSQLEQAREVGLQHMAFGIAAATRLRQAPCNQALEEYFKRDLPSMLLTSRPGIHTDSTNTEKQLLEMMDAMSEAVEPSSVVGRHTAI